MEAPTPAAEPAVEPAAEPEPEPAPVDPMVAILADAKVIEEGEVAKDLIAIAPGNKALKWRTDGPKKDRPQVLMVTWTDWSGYGEQVGKSMTLSREVWLTTAPEVQDFCRGLGSEGEALQTRLEQYLGIPPGKGKTHFVEMWVRPRDLLRPCADPEITDSVCTTTDQPAALKLGSHDHQAWYEALRAKSYEAGGYPWTRLGYTYDWGAESERGPSEFLIPAGMEVVVVAFTPTAEYCKAAAN